MPGAKHIYVVVLRPVSRCTGTVRRRFILRELHLIVVLIEKKQKSNCKSLVLVPSCCHTAVELKYLTFPIGTDGSLHHDGLSWAILVNVWCCEPLISPPIAPETAVFLIKGKAFFVGPNDSLTIHRPLPHGPSAVVRGPCESGSNMVRKKVLLLYGAPANQPSTSKSPVDSLAADLNMTLPVSCCL